MSEAGAGNRRTHHVSAYGRTIVIDSDAAELSLPFLPFAWSETPLSESVDRRYAITPADNDRWTLSIDNELQNWPRELDEISDQIEGDLHHWLATYTRGFLFVHAGCVGWQGRAIVIPGRSHAGKTTLTRALLELGAVYYSDDYAVINPAGEIHAFPRRLQVRPDPPGPTFRLDPASRNWEVGYEPIRAALVAELKFDRERGWDIEPLARGAGALALLDNTVAARERPLDALKIMSITMDGAIAIKGTRDEAARAACRLLEMVDALD